MSSGIFKRTLRIAVVFAGACFALSAQATPLLDITSALTAADPTQLGRISRDGVPSEWSTPKVFPGVINPATAYKFNTYSVNTGYASYIQIMMDSVSANTFAAVYKGSYQPATGLGTNYLGDAGTSGNYFGTDPIFFQIAVPIFTDLVIVINETSGAGLGLNQSFRILVEGFIDSEYTDIPAPGTASLFFSALLAFGFTRKRGGFSLMNRAI